MEEDRKKYKLVRLLTGGVTPLLLAGALLAFARLHDGAWEPGVQVAGICRELIAGSTEGRQALFGSCWLAPLPVLVYLPFAWLLPEPAAGGTAFFVAWLFVFWTVRESVKATGVSGWRVVMSQAAIAAMMAVSRQPQALQIATALTTGLVLLTASSLADWAAFRRLRDLVSGGSAAALLMLCGFPFFGAAALMVCLLPLAACGHEESRARFQAWFLLGGLPLVYALAVLLLMNRLILGDAFFFLRSLQHLVPHLYLFLSAVLATGLVMVPAMVLTWALDRRSEKPGGGPVAASALLISFALLLVCGTKVLGKFDIGWDAVNLSVCVLCVLMIAMSRLHQPIYRFGLSLILFVWLSTLWLGGAARVAPAEPRRQIREEVEAYVNARTTYGRVFVLGYAGLDLLRGYTGERLVPNMDLHVGSLRRAYKGQNLYVLVPRPEGAVKAESVFWKYPDIYVHGAERLLYAKAFGSWRLFEVVSAPTQEQLDEWKTKR